MDNIKVAEQQADLITLELRKQIKAIGLLHPMEQKRVHELMRYQILKYLDGLQQPTSRGI